MSDDLTPQDWLTAQRVLRAVLRDPALADDHAEFRTLVAGVNRLGRKHARQAALGATPAASDEPRVRCYMCRQPFTPGAVSALCPDCAALNDRKRALSADLRGRVALLTGGRVRIGYATSLRLLRCGAQVIVTTRFPQDAARRYAQEPDAQEWADRLTLHGLDLRDVRAAQQFADELLRSLPHLDVLINNAAQTVAKPGAALAALLASERQALPGSGAGRHWVIRPVPAHLLARPPELHPEFPPGLLDEHGDPLDLRVQNSWTARLDDVPLRELLEVQLVNVTAPGLLSSALLPLLRRSPFPRRFIVNVSSVEGQFARAGRSNRHPHTNMAKAALNMLTRTSGPALARQGIFMTSVDPGWVSHQEPHEQRLRMAADGFRFPLTLEDAAARLCDPVLTGVTDPARPPAGVFLKDYRVQPW